ncbi:hypothetical protein [Streptomyces sp. CC210A]|uniref:SCO2583 family membrane protein n=1 Tax=Streptomyces sp. CC210A TaxID=2898184 RepID=UPI001F21CBCD|nr:hypothetical protein [Streptomyces sp. CC210A]
MAGSVDPPDGTPDGTPEGRPGGGEDEYRSVVFDESFIRAARLRELSAQERLDGRSGDPVRHRTDGSGQGPGEGCGGDRDDGSVPPRSQRHGSRTGALALVLVVAMIFAAAVHLVSRGPHGPPFDQPAQPARMSVVALAPQGPVPGGTPAELYTRAPAAQHRTGAAGVTLPPARGTAHFTQSQVLAALSTAKDYLVQSSLDPDVLSGSTDRPVRLLLDPDQLAQFDRSIDRPATDGRHTVGGWLVRFDPDRVVLADPEVRVHGTLGYTETSADELEVVSQHTFTYALRPVSSDAGAEDASLFTVRRELRFHFDREDLRLHRAELVTSSLWAGPLDCAADLSGTLSPLLAGQRATSTTAPATDPYGMAPASAAPACAALAPDAQPTPP